MARGARPGIPPGYDPARDSGGYERAACAARQACPGRAGQRLAMPGRYLPSAHRRSCKLETNPQAAHPTKSGECMKQLAILVAATAAALSTSLPASASEELAKK